VESPGALRPPGDVGDTLRNPVDSRRLPFHPGQAAFFRSTERPSTGDSRLALAKRICDRLETIRAPLDPSNPFCFLPDLRIGTRVPGANRMTVWGKGLFETDERLLAERRAGAVGAGIGPAEEKPSRMVCVRSEGRYARSAGRTGMDAVMGSKNLTIENVLGDRMGADSRKG